MYSIEPNRKSGTPTAPDGCAPIGVWEEDLSELMAELGRSSAELEQFASAACRDLREPLVVMRRFAHLLKLHSAERLAFREREWIDFIVEEIDRLRTMIDHLLDLSRVDSEAGDSSEVELGEIEDYVLQDVAAQAGAIIERATLPLVQGDRAQLSELIQNLLSNAIKLRGAASPRIQIGAVERGAKARVCIHDNGIGIDPRQSCQIFRLFHRLHRNGDYSGFGLGLAVCEKVVHRHVGRIWVESTPGEGARFYFTLQYAGRAPSA